MTQDDPLATYRRDGENSKQALARLSAVVGRAREEEVVSEFSAIDGGSAILANATRVFGTSAAACAWLSLRAISLNGQRPLDILKTRGGAQVLTDLLGRLEYGVYS